MTRPKLLDLFSGAGGATRGYQLAGFHVTGVDLTHQPRYIGDEFIRADALDVLDNREFVSTFDAIHASPPCQRYSRAMRHLVTKDYPRLIGPVRDRLTAAGVPWIIENVVGAPLPHQSDLFGAHGVELCGTMFGLRIWRHRLFETSWPVWAPRGCNHSLRPLNPDNDGNRKTWRPILGPDTNPERAWRAEMAVPWMTGGEADESIPPCFTEWIGGLLLAELADETTGVVGGRVSA